MHKDSVLSHSQCTKCTKIVHCGLRKVQYMHGTDNYSTVFTSEEAVEHLWYAISSTHKQNALNHNRVLVSRWQNICQRLFLLLLTHIESHGVRFCPCCFLLEAVSWPSSKDKTGQRTRKSGILQFSSFFLFFFL